MTAPKLRSLTVKGFRSFGRVEQKLSIPAGIAAVWAPNSKGKTSLAEAVEFLLTGRIVRRTLMSSTQDEFADALRNAHLPLQDEVYVAASILAADGTVHELRRVLDRDYAKRQDCASSLQIDGNPATGEDLAALGIHLSQPPLEAPVLAQYTLSYIFSVRPQDRATYFKTLLEVTDLDDLRADIAALSDRLAPPEDPLLAKFDAARGIDAISPVLATILSPIATLESLKESLATAAQNLLERAGASVPTALDQRLRALGTSLTERRSKTFPIQGFSHAEIGPATTPSEDPWTRLDTYLEEQQKIDEETRQLSALFEQALKLPSVSGITDPADCPLCATPEALTPARVEIIRQHVEDTRGFKAAETAARSALQKLANAATALADTATSSVPRLLQTTVAKRRQTGFTIARLRELLGDSADDLVNPWLEQLRPLARAASALRRRSRAAAARTENQAAALSTALAPEELRRAFADLTTLRSNLAAAIEAYKPPAHALLEALSAVIDAEADTAGWQDFLDVARQPADLRKRLIERLARAAVAAELDQAIKDIDQAKERVLDDKFVDYSAAIQTWWERLRPDEPTFFSAVQPRPKARRTIDIKAGLSPNPDRSSPKVRDVIAVFSQSQLHCLGLAMFLARAQQEGLGFIVLDDPVLSSDEDYRVHFNSTVLANLLSLGVQTIVLTQDHQTWEELETRYRYLGISNAQLFIDSPAEGTVIENTSDALLSKINRAKSLALGGHPDLRKECGRLLRDAGERFCKEILIQDRHAKGDAAASLSDYDGKSLEWFRPHVEPLLVQDPSHPGKLVVFRNTVNRACHDDTPPGNAEMKQACGDLRRFVKDYLGR